MPPSRAQKWRISKGLLIPASIICFGFLSKCLVLYSLPTKNLFERDSFRYLNLSRDFFGIYFSQSGDPLAFDISPGFPFFLYLLGSFTPKQIVITQFLVLSISQFLLFRILAKHFSYSYAVFGLLLFTFESSINTSSFKILSESLLLLLLTLSIYVISADSISFSYKILSGVALGLAILVKPIAQFIFFVIVIALLYNFKKVKRLLPTLLTCLAIMLGWISFNNAKYDIPQISGIQSYNLLYYEGAGAKSYESGSTLLDVQTNEFALEQEFSEINTKISEIVDYRVRRGVVLISNNFGGFLEMHFTGILKILFGPGSATISQIAGHFPLQHITQIMVISFSLFSSTLLALGSVIALLYVFPRSHKEKGLLLFLATFSFAALLLISSGANAYSRFRVPLVPFEIILLGYTYETLRIKFLSRGRRV